MDTLLARHHKLMTETDTTFVRYMDSRISWEARLIGLTGPRGVGKTTLVMQHAKTALPPDKTLYVSAEDLYFADHKLLDLADNFTRRGGEHLIIDEIHRYADWSRELKLIYDYHPELQVIFTGSSVLDITRGAADLSRRALMYSMQGLSFREYLALFHHICLPVASLTDILAGHYDLPSGFRPLAYFGDFLRHGYYPFGGDDTDYLRLRQIVGMTLETDIPQYASMNAATGRKLKQLLAIIARSVPFKPNASSIAEALGVSRSSVADYCLYIEQAGLIAQLRDDTGGIRGLGKVEKIYIDNPTLAYALGGDATDIGNIRETFFLGQTRIVADVTSSSASYFRIGRYTFEIGGRKKGRKQIEGIENAFVVKDDIEYGGGDTLPLWLFGMLY